MPPPTTHTHKLTNLTNPMRGITTTSTSDNDSTFEAAGSDSGTHHTNMFGTCETNRTNAQPTNQPTNKQERTNQPTNQPTNEPTNEPTFQRTNEPTNQRTNKRTNEPTNQRTQTSRRHSLCQPRLHAGASDNLNSQITNHKSQITNHKSQITNHKSQITNHKSDEASAQRCSEVSRFRIFFQFSVFSFQFSVFSFQSITCHLSSVICQSSCLAEAFKHTDPLV